ncbi:shikimate kinase [Gottfriedia acidiceleris]|uniref:Shikimate kinase n=1 Tax=Gottfriedia acidiceleris TaxID=371036 RepID=A0ABY4JS57_9BACI|nr:shikimate kinase [Gottfriedia acidiceleris]UPM55688.1 shikimate kinase [Gottfriedia acidiceleris]
MESIYLVGFMGCGKTTVGKELAKRANKKFIDLDEEIVFQTGKSIPELFNEFGESGFRDIETKVLKNLPSKKMIASTGGGIILRDENIEYMKETGKIIYLETPIEIIYERIHLDSNRPNAVNRTIEELTELFKKRESQYKKADYEVSTTNLTPIEIALGIIDCLNYSKGGDSRNR